MHVTTIEEKLALRFAHATWSDRDTAIWTEDGGPRMLLVRRGAALAAADLVDAHLRRAPGARLVVAHEGAPTAVARRTAERFGIELLDLATIPEPDAAPATPEAAPGPSPEPAAAPEPEHAPSLHAEVPAEPEAAPPLLVEVAPPAPAAEAPLLPEMETPALLAPEPEIIPVAAEAAPEPERALALHVELPPAPDLLPELPTFAATPPAAEPTPLEAPEAEVHAEVAPAAVEVPPEPAPMAEAPVLVADVTTPAAEMAAPDFPLPPGGFFLRLERPMVAPSEFPLPAPRFFDALERPEAAPPEFSAPPSGFFRALERPVAAPADFALPPPAFFRALERPEVVLDFPLPEEGLLAALDVAPPRVEAPGFPVPAEGFFDALDLALVHQALEEVVPDALLDAPASGDAVEEPAYDAQPALPWPAAPELLVAPPSPEPAPAPLLVPDLPWGAEPAAAVAALPEPSLVAEPVAEPMVAAEAVAEPALAAQPMTEPMPWQPAALDADPMPWDAAPAAPAPVEAMPLPAPAVTAAEAATMPWNAPAPAEEDDVELISTPRAPAPIREPMPHPTMLPLQPDRAWGLPWPRPVQPMDGLAIADPALWNVRERTVAIRDGLDQQGGASFGAVQPSGSAWLRRLQSFGAP